MDVGWLSSQLVVGVVVIVLVVGGLAFFAAGGRGRAGGGAADATGGVPEPGRVPTGEQGADAEAEAAGDVAGDVAGEAGAETARTSVFETEPCWASLLPRRGGDASPASRAAPAPDTGAAPR